MCRSILTLFNFEPPATDADVRAAALQYVRKLSGYRAPSQANQAVFDAAVEEIAAATARLLEGLTTRAPTRDRDEEREKARAKRAAQMQREAQQQDAQAMSRSTPQ